MIVDDNLPGSNLSPGKAYTGTEKNTTKLISHKKRGSIGHYFGLLLRSVYTEVSHYESIQYAS